MIFNFKIKLKTGSGGDGINCFYYKNNKIIPSGGDGGNSGNIILKFDKNIKNIDYYIFNNKFKTEKGFKGNCNFGDGGNSGNIILRLPFNTINFFKKKFIVLKGNLGGYGNSHFKKKYNFFFKGEKFKEILLKFKINLKYNVSILGSPNSGKTTFIFNLSKNFLKISNYIFTTKNPLKIKLKELIFIDFPGFIKNSFTGKAMGIKFLDNHKNFIIFNFIDLSLLNFNVKKFLKNIRINSNEIYNYKKLFWYKPKWLILNKFDLIKNIFIKIFIKKIFNIFNWNNVKFFFSSLNFNKCLYIYKLFNLKFINNENKKLFY